jgi:hypothetical protein
MMTLKKPALREFVYVHAIFAVACVFGLLIPGAIPISARMLLLVIFYNTLIPFVALIQNLREWISIWGFSLFLSIFQIWPDWYLSAELGILVFPDDGFPMIGTVPIYMAGLWAIPFFIIIFVGDQVHQRRPNWATFLVVGILSLTIFGLAEQLMWMLPSWSAQNVTMVGHVALYIIGPEVILGVSTFIAFESVRDRPLWIMAIGAFFVMILYMGNLSFFYFAIERILLQG